MSVSPSSSSSFLKILGRLLAAFACLVIIFVILLPTLLSTSWARTKLIDQINQEIPGHLEISQLSISWLGPQEIEGLTLTDPQNKSILSVQKGFIDASLFSLAIDQMAAGALRIEDLNAILAVDANGVTNFERALNRQCCANASLDNKNPIPDIIIKDVQAQANLTSNATPLTLKLTGTTQQGTQTGKFSINAELNAASKMLLNNPSDWSKLLLSAENALKVDIDVANFPVEILAQILEHQNPKIAELIPLALGPQLNLTVKQTTTPQGIGLALNAKSTNMIASAVALVAEDFHFTQPGTIELKITPTLVEKLFESAELKKPWTLTSPTAVKMTINDLHFPLKTWLNASEIDLTALALKAELNFDPAAFNNKTIALQKLNATIETKSGSNHANATLAGEAVQNGKPVRININAVVPKPPKLPHFMRNLLKELSLEGQAVGIPLSAIDEQIGVDGRLVGALGEQGLLSFTYKMKENRPRVTLNWKSETLEIPDISFFVERKITLEQPAQITWLINPQFLDQLFPSHFSRNRAPVKAIFTLDHFSIPFPDQNDGEVGRQLALNYLSLEADLKFSTLALQNLPHVGEVNINDMNFHITANSGLPLRVTMATSLSQPKETGMLTSVFGKKIDLTGMTVLSLVYDSAPLIEEFHFQLASGLAHVQVNGMLGDDNKLLFTTPAMITYTLTSEAIQSLGLASDAYLFKHSTPLEFTFAASRIPLSFEEASQLLIKGNIKINDLSIGYKNQNNFPVASLDNFVADWSIDTLNKPKITLNYSADTRLKDLAAGKVTGALLVSNWLQDSTIDFSKAEIHATNQAIKLPVEILNLLIARQNLIPLIGDALDLKTILHYSADTQKGSLLVDLQSTHAKGSVDLILANGIQLKDPQHPGEFHLLLTPQGYDVVRLLLGNEGKNQFALTEPMNVIVKLNTFHMPLLADQVFQPDYLNSTLNLELFADLFNGMNTTTQQKIILRSIHSKINSKNLSKHVSFDLQAKGQSGQGESTGWNLVGALDNGFTPQGNINTEDLSLALDATIETLPVDLFCQFACTDPDLAQQIKAIVGTSFDAQIKAKLHQMNGPLYVDLKGKNGHLLLDGTINDSILTLNKDMHVQVSASPQLSEYVLNRFLPIVNGMLSAEQPLKLTIERQGFALSLKDPTLTGITMPKATLDLGKVFFSSKSELAKVLSLLVSSKDDQLKVWLTPVYFSISKGLVNIDRFDMLINERYPIAGWGKVDVGNDKVNMTIGLTGASISRAFNVRGIPNSYILQLPVKGSLSKADIDKTKAAARLSALVAQAQGGTQGLVIGTVLHIASGGLTEGTPPEPSTKPLPWNDLLEDKEASSTDSDAAPSKNKKIDEIKKGASNLLKQFLK